MRYLPLLFAGLLVQAATFAQDTASTELTKLTTVTLLSPGVSHEVPVGSDQSLYIHPHLAISAQWGSSYAFGSYSEVIANPAVSLQYRYYYNRGRRAQKGKRIERNSGNYLAGVYAVSFSKEAIWEDHKDEDNRRPIHLVGAVWGMQRNGAKRFSFGLQGGVGYFYARGTEWNDSAVQWKTVRRGDATVIVDLNIGFWLGKR